MKLLRNARKKAAVIRHGESAILFGIGEFTFLIAAEEVDEIREMHGLESVATATMRTSVAKIRHAVHKAGQMYFVIDGGQHFQITGSKPTRLMLMRNHPVAVTVDSIDRMTEMDRVLPVPKAFSGPERTWYRGLAVQNEKVIPVVSGTAFLTAGEQVIAKAALSHMSGKGARA